MFKRLLTSSALVTLIAAPTAVSAGTPGTTAQKGISEAQMHKADETSQLTEGRIEHQNSKGEGAPHPLFIDEQKTRPQTAEAPEPETPEPQQTAAVETPKPVRETTVYFDLDESHLRPRGESKVDALAERAQDGDAVVVKGYTDTTASESYNMDLSRERAREVAQALVAEGVDDGKISADWYGENRLAVQTADGVLEQDNRRARIVVKD